MYLRWSQHVLLTDEDAIQSWKFWWFHFSVSLSRPLSQHHQCCIKWDSSILSVYLVIAHITNLILYLTAGKSVQSWGRSFRHIWRLEDLTKDWQPGCMTKWMTKLFKSAFASWRKSMLSLNSNLSSSEVQYFCSLFVSPGDIHCFFVVESFDWLDHCHLDTGINTMCTPILYTSVGWMFELSLNMWAMLNLTCRFFLQFLFY